MKKFAFYLPQYYETKENNKWWGKGFTEWTHVKSAKPLFKNHNQPIVPLNDNYYNLLNKETVIWQTSLMNQYGIDGLIYYHYYFNDSILLEKPAENLLNWKDIKQHFFFCWANHSWYKAKNGKKNLLKEQDYGNKTDWENHFNYLLPFFFDERYEKKDNKPIFMVFDSNFSEKDEMFRLFDVKCKENGFDGIHIIETFYPKSGSLMNEMHEFESNFSIQSTQLFLREPTNCNYLHIYNTLHSIKRVPRILTTIMTKLNIKGFVRHFDGNTLFDEMINTEPHSSNIIPGLFFSWDNTPRHDNRGYIISKPDKAKFIQYMNTIKDNDYVFINAWNEWAEGMILEPTVTDDYENLSWIKEWSDSNK